MEEFVLEASLPYDDEGFLDRQCHSENCGRYFKVLGTDWEAADITTATCPFCGFADEPSSFITAEQQDYCTELAVAHVKAQIQQTLQGMARRLNQGQSRNSLFSIEVTSKFSHIAEPVSPDALAAMRLQIECDQCGCTY